MRTAVRRFALPTPLLALLVLAAAGCGGDGGSGAATATDVLLVSRDDGIKQVSLETGEETLIIPRPADSFLSYPAVSPDGELIAYIAQVVGIPTPGQFQDYGSDLYVAKRDGSGARLLLRHEGRGDLILAPAWFPDSRALLVSTQLFREGRFISTLVRVEAETGANTPVIEDAIQPDASTDGAFVAYLRVDDNLNQTLTVAGADGANPRTLVAAGEGFVSFGAPRFSPDGGAIAFGASDQAIARSDSSARYVARAASASSSSPSARSLNGGPMDIYTIPSEGGEPRKLADLDFDSPSLAWSGDGRLIFVMDASGIYAIDAEAGEYNRVADGTYHGQIDWVAPR